MPEELIEADLTWDGERFTPGLRVRIEGDRIAEVGALTGEPTRRLQRRALLPGFVDGHSHAFQRGLRGHGERFPAGAGSFWTWRQAMYALVDSLDRDRLYRLSCQTFREMLAAGITTVGEFHYVHHTSDGEPFAGDLVMLQAARDTGIRMVLLLTFYRTGGVGEPLRGGQLRFSTQSLPEYWTQLDRLGALLDPATQSLGVVGHSLRAVTLDDVHALAAGARERGMVLHMHVEEQRQEIAACVDAYQRWPMELLLEHARPDHRFTAIHCTHSRTPDLDAYFAAGANVCLCPLTEGNLGDGIFRYPGLRQAAQSDQICLGGDSNARISMLEQMRLLEFVQRVQREERGVVCDEGGANGRQLLRVATQGGARALGLPVGRIAAGQLADFCLVDLDHPSLAGTTLETACEAILDEGALEDALVFGGADGAIAGVCVGGRWLSAPRPSA
jgi:formimidoylglutamate deiminase